MNLTLRVRTPMRSLIVKRDRPWAGLADRGAQLRADDDLLAPIEELGDRYLGAGSRCCTAKAPPSTPHRSPTSYGPWRSRAPGGDC
jgi:uncharacterized protein with PhoU and TrkA domain